MIALLLIMVAWRVTNRGIITQKLEKSLSFQMKQLYRSMKNIVETFWQTEWVFFSRKLLKQWPTEPRTMSIGRGPLYQLSIPVLLLVVAQGKALASHTMRLYVLIVMSVLARKNNGMSRVFRQRAYSLALRQQEQRFKMQVTRACTLQQLSTDMYFTSKLMRSISLSLLPNQWHEQPWLKSCSK